MVAAPVTQEEQDAEAANGMGQGAGAGAMKICTTKLYPIPEYPWRPSTQA